MKTAILKTDIWKDESFCQLPIDTQYLFFYLSTSPERNCTRYYQQRENVIASYVGLIPDALRECMRQLAEKGLAFHFDGWVIIGDDSYVQPSKGKDTYGAFTKDYYKVPAHVIDFAEKMIPGASNAALEYIERNRKSSGATPEYKDKNKDKDKAKDKNKAKDRDRDIAIKKETLGAIRKAGS